MSGNRHEGFDQEELLLIAGVGLVLFVLMKGGIRNAAESIGSGIVNAAGGVVTGGVDTIGQGVGLPALSDITTDKYVARYIIDHPNGGTLAASKWASAAAFGAALFLDAWSGHMPPTGSAIYRAFPPTAYEMPASNSSGSGSTDSTGNAADYGWPADLSLPM